MLSIIFWLNYPNGWIWGLKRFEFMPWAFTGLWLGELFVSFLLFSSLSTSCMSFFFYFCTFYCWVLRLSLGESVLDSCVLWSSSSIFSWISFSTIENPLLIRCSSFVTRLRIIISSSSLRSSLALPFCELHSDLQCSVADVRSRLIRLLKRFLTAFSVRELRRLFETSDHFFPLSRINLSSSKSSSSPQGPLE